VVVGTLAGAGNTLTHKVGALASPCRLESGIRMRPAF